MNTVNIYKKALSTWGIGMQSIKACEECGELIQAISKVLLKKGSKTHLIEELADVQIMIEQLVYVYKIKKQFEKMRTAKLQRLKLRLLNVKERT